MRRLITASVMFLGLALPLSSFAQAPAVTATCKDGTTFSGATRSGACRGHQGVQSWGEAATTTAPTTPAAPSSPAKPAATGQATGTPGNGQVWVNSKSKVYHCPGDRDYGHTKQGSYMTEAAAKAEGDRPSRGKACS